MDELAWGTVISAVAVIAAGLLVWRIAGACWLTQVGAFGTMVGGLLAIVPAFAIADQDVAMRASFAITILSAAWLLGWVLASGINMRRIARAQAAAARESVAMPVVPQSPTVGLVEPAPAAVGAAETAAPTV
jgi:hypothetical protein